MRALKIVLATLYFLGSVAFFVLPLILFFGQNESADIFGMWLFSLGALLTGIAIIGAQKGDKT